MNDSNDTPSGDLANLLHELALGLFKTRLLLEEADADEYRLIIPRLNTLKDLVASFPTKPRSRRTLGFVAPVAGSKRRK